MQLHHSSCFRLLGIRALISVFLRRSVLTMVAVCPVMPMVAAHAQNSAQIPSWLQQPMTLADARHLVGRTGLGASPEELSVFLTMSRKDAVNVIVEGINTQPHVPMPAWTNAPAPHFWTRRFLSSSMKLEFNADRNKEMEQLRRWWVNNMLQTRSPQTERLVLFWHDHFATSYEGVAQRSISMARQNQLFRDKGVGSYRELLKAIIRDPAMLLYLDNQSNRKGKPNENLARELLELFTLGEGNFDEATVKEAARALTGYGFSDTRNLSFKLHGGKRDMEDKTLFGKTANHDGDALIDLILEQPEAAEYLVKKFWHAFVSDAVPNSAFITNVSREFRQSDYNLNRLYTSVLMSEAFWQKENRLALIKSPATLLIGTARSLDYPKRAWTQMPSLMAMLGMNLFSPPNVAGWNEGAAYVVPGILLNRQLAMQTLLSAPSTPAKHSQSMLVNSEGTENQMTGTSTMAVDAESNVQYPLQVRVAGEFFRGAPQYKVSLYSSDQKELWTSEIRTLDFGHDTEVFGNMRDMSQLAWQTARFHPPANAVSKSARVKVTYLNDIEDKTGDRNLFVESVSINGETFATLDAQHESNCPPKNPRHAGRLRCGGSVAVELDNNLDNSVTRTAPYTASSATLLWGQHRKNKLALTITLENVKTPQAYFHTVSFQMSSNNASEMELILDSYGCWPDCVKPWPKCAWSDGRSQEKRLMFPLRRGLDAQLDCHYNSISVSEQELVNALYSSLPDLLNRLSGNTINANQESVVEKWQDRIVGFESQIKSSVYGNNSTPISINQRYSQPELKPVVLEEPLIAINNVDSFARLANDANLSLAELLIGGTPAELFPDLQGNSSVPIKIQLEKLLAHPVYQVY